MNKYEEDEAWKEAQRLWPEWIARTRKQIEEGVAPHAPAISGFCLEATRMLELHSAYVKHDRTAPEDRLRHLVNAVRFLLNHPDFDFVLKRIEVGDSESQAIEEVLDYGNYKIDLWTYSDECEPDYFDELMLFEGSVILEEPEYLVDWFESEVNEETQLETLYSRVQAFQFSSLQDIFDWHEPSEVLMVGAPELSWIIQQQDAISLETLKIVSQAIADERITLSTATDGITGMSSPRDNARGTLHLEGSEEGLALLSAMVHRFNNASYDTGWDPYYDPEHEWELAVLQWVSNVWMIREAEAEAYFRKLEAKEEQRLLNHDRGLDRFGREEMRMTGASAARLIGGDTLYDWITDPETPDDDLPRWAR